MSNICMGLQTHTEVRISDFRLYKSNQVQSYAHCGQTQESGSVTSFMHLKWNHFLQVITLNHVSVITFRESTYAVNMNECMLLPTFLNRPFCRGEGCKLFILKTLFKMSSHFICIPIGVEAIMKIAM